MFFKVYSVQVLSESASFVQDLKLGHYIKVPPRATFIGVSPSCTCQDVDANSVLVQIVGTIFVAFVQSAVKAWIFSNVPDICTPDQSSHLTCPHNNVFFSASAIWCVLVPWG